MIFPSSRGQSGLPEINKCYRTIYSQREYTELQFKEGLHMRETCKTRFQLRATIMFVVALMMMIMVADVTTIISHAEEIKVTASSVVIRASADVNSEMIGGAMAGQTLQLTGEVAGSGGYTWYQVTFEGDNGTMTGYVRSDCASKVGGTGTTPATPTTPTTPTTPPSTPTTEVIELQPISAKVKGGSSINVRSNASTSGTVVAKVQRDVALTVVGEAMDSESQTWYQVNFSNASGQVTGFIRGDYVNLEGERVPVVQTPEVPEDPVDDPVEPEPTQAPVHRDYETQLYDEDGWNLLDYTKNPAVRYPIADLLEAANSSTESQKKYEESQAQLKSTKVIMIILVILVIVLALAATLLFFKIRDMMDAAYFEEVEKETIRKRQGAGGKASMPTVGSGSRPAGSSQQRTSGSSQQKTSGTSQQRSSGSSQQRPAEGGQQRASSSSQQRPAGSGQQRPAGSGQARPAGSQQRPSGSGQARPAGSQQKPAGSGQARPAGQQQGRPAETQNAPKQSKNFMTDDDEFDFEYLNWDGEEDN